MSPCSFFLIAFVWWSSWSVKHFEHPESVQVSLTLFIPFLIISLFNYFPIFYCIIVKYIKGTCGSIQFSRTKFYEIFWEFFISSNNSIKCCHKVIIKCNHVLKYSELYLHVIPGISQKNFMVILSLACFHSTFFASIFCVYDLKQGSWLKPILSVNLIG